MQLSSKFRLNTQNLFGCYSLLCRLRIDPALKKGDEKNNNVLHFICLNHKLYHLLFESATGSSGIPIPGLSKINDDSFPISNC